VPDAHRLGAVISQAMPLPHRGDAHRRPRAYATMSLAMPKFIPALNVLTPRRLFKAVAA
jgi:hypothetical protein